MGTKIQSSRLIWHISLVEMQKTVPTATVLLVGTAAWVAQSTHHHLTPPPPPPPHDRNQNHSILSLFSLQVSTGLCCVWHCVWCCVVFGVALTVRHLSPPTPTSPPTPPPPPPYRNRARPFQVLAVPRVNTLTDGVCRPPDSIAAVPRLD